MSPKSIAITTRLQERFSYRLKCRNEAMSISVEQPSTRWPMPTLMISITASAAMQASPGQGSLQELI